jgi:hypothetical protein
VEWRAISSSRADVYVASASLQAAESRLAPAAPYRIDDQIHRAADRLELLREWHVPMELPTSTAPSGHSDPDALHIVRACSPTDLLFLPPGPGDLRQFRGLLRMRDSAVVVGRARIQLRRATGQPEPDRPLPPRRNAPTKSRTRRVFVRDGAIAKGMEECPKQAKPRYLRRAR